LTKVLSTKLSLEDHSTCKLIAGHLFNERIIDESTTSALIRALLMFAIKDFKDWNMQNLYRIIEIYMNNTRTLFSSLFLMW
jgi:hypothetical protein